LLIAAAIGLLVYLRSHRFGRARLASLRNSF
jgi:hypothetical protein